MNRLAIVSLVVSLWMACFSLARAQPAPEETARTPTEESPAGNLREILQPQPSFYVGMQVNRDSRIYREGDELALTVVSEVDAYLYVLYQQADGKVFQIFPNSVKFDNRVKAKQATAIPDPRQKDRFAWTIGAPFGKESIIAVAAKEPVAELADPALMKRPFNRVSEQKLKGLELEVGERAPTAWGESRIEITTYDRDERLEAEGAKRYGVFVGVSDHLFATEEELATGKSPNLPTCHRDARRLAAVMQDVGRLDGAKIYTNDQATRANFEQALTKWLPRVSRPGDTVFIYFSGHGMQLADDNGDEPDKQDELLVTHDYFGIAALAGLLKRQEAGELTTEQAQYVQAARTVAARAQGNAALVEQLLVRATAVSDDLFARWIQGLSGRQVIVLLDSCHSGGFERNENEKGNTTGRANGQAKGQPKEAFDFLDLELNRLKDIGQAETALFATCRAGAAVPVPQSGELPGEHLSLMTYFLSELINGAPAAVNLPQAHDYTTDRMTEYFAKTGRPPVLPAPLVNRCNRPVLLKP